jgi:hypothetical protein
VLCGVNRIKQLQGSVRKYEIHEMETEKMSILDKVEQLKQVWALFLKITAPENDVLAQWASVYSSDELEYAIMRTSKKTHHQPMEPDIAHRYCSGVLKNERNAPQRMTR